VQLDFSATPRFTKGAIFPWTISDYPLKQAIIDNIVKRPMKGIAHIVESKSEYASVRYKGYLTAAVERWREYREQLKTLRRNPLMFVMMNDTEEADDVADWLRSSYPAEFGAKKTQVIHTDKSLSGGWLPQSAVRLTEPTRCVVQGRSKLTLDGH
jgi:type III restriction enzyme